MYFEVAAAQTTLDQTKLSLHSAGHSRQTSCTEAVKPRLHLTRNSPHLYSYDPCTHGYLGTAQGPTTVSYLIPSTCPSTEALAVAR